MDAQTQGTLLAAGPPPPEFSPSTNALPSLPITASITARRATDVSWHARLQLRVRTEGARTVTRFEHEGPLRLLQTLYPEGDAIAHNVLVHPPSGIVGGDTLEIDIGVAAGAHGLVTTPGASRFYRSDAARAVQSTRIGLAESARFEWLPLETLCYSGCIATNRLVFDLAPGAEAMGWDVTALGLPTAGAPFVEGELLQHVELHGQWLERGRIAARDARLMDGALGLQGRRCVATLFLICGSDIARPRRELLLDAAREVIGSHELAAWAGATAPGPRVLVVRAVAPLVEPAMTLLRAVRQVWRPLAWNLGATSPRTWAA